MLFVLIGNWRSTIDWKAEFKSAWPLIVLIICDIAYYLIVFLFVRDTGLDKLAHPRWWINIIITVCSLFAAYVLGRLNRGRSNSAIASFLIVLIGISFIFGFLQYVHYLGWSNPVALWLEQFNAHTKTLYGVWEWTPFETGVRVSGLNTNPVSFVFPALIGLAWVCSVDALYWQRIGITFFSLGIILLSGSRSALVVAVILGAVFFLRSIYPHKKRNTDKKKLSLLIVSVIFCLSVLVAVFFPGNNLIMRIRKAGTSVATQGVSSSNLDSLSSGRITAWHLALQTIKHHPLGTWRPLGNITGTMSGGVQVNYWHAHNDLINRYLSGGPLLFIPLVIFLFWLFRFRERADMRSFGLYFLLVVGLFGVFDTVFFDKPHAVLGLFLLGVGASFSGGGHQQGGLLPTKQFGA
jgi:hypothetical protein